MKTTQDATGAKVEKLNEFQSAALWALWRFHRKHKAAPVESVAVALGKSPSYISHTFAELGRRRLAEKAHGRWLITKAGRAAAAKLKRPSGVRIPAVLGLGNQRAKQDRTIRIWSFRLGGIDGQSLRVMVAIDDIKEAGRDATLIAIAEHCACTEKKAASKITGLLQERIDEWKHLWPTEDGEGLICLTKDGRGPNCYHLTPSGVAHLEKYEAVFRNFDRKPSERTA